MRSIDFIALTETALILTFSPREKEAERAPMRNRYTRYDACSSLPLGETLAQAAVRVQEWVGEGAVLRL
jgi:hypothetical protein